MPHIAWHRLAQKVNFTHTSGVSALKGKISKMLNFFLDGGRAESGHSTKHWDPSFLLSTPDQPFSHSISDDTAPMAATMNVVDVI